MHFCIKKFSRQEVRFCFNPILFLIFVLLFYACQDNSSTITGNNRTKVKLDPIREQAYELPPSPEPTANPNRIAVLSHSRYHYHDLAREIQSYYNAALLHVNDNTDSTLLEKLNKINPRYAIIVLPPHQINTDKVASLFKIFCSLGNERILDIAYGYISGTTIDDARKLFYQSKVNTGEIKNFMSVTHVYWPDSDAELNLFFSRSKYAYEWDSWIINTYKNLSAKFSQNGWETDSIIINQTLWGGIQNEELSKITTNQLIFMIEGEKYLFHSDPPFRTYSVLPLSEQLKIDLSGDIVLSSNELSNYSAADSYKIRMSVILKNGVAGYITTGWYNDWMNMNFIAEKICQNNISLGRAVRDGINAEIEYFNITDLDIRMISTESFEIVEQNKRINSIARIILFGDPLYRPNLHSEVALPKQDFLY